MGFNPNKTPVKVIKKGSFGETSFRDIYSGVNRKSYKNLWKEFHEIKNIDQKQYPANSYDVELNKYQVTIGTSLIHQENKSWINEIDLMDGFNDVLDTFQEDLQMILDKQTDGIVD